MVIVFLVLLVLSGIGLIIFILMHSGKGTGISDAIASSMYSTQTGTSIIEKNLDRITIACAVVSGVTYLIAGVLVTAGAPGIVSLPIGIVLMLGFLFVMKGRRQSA